jgi:ABC-2 type transport system ATP-binding protein
MAGNAIELRGVTKTFRAPGTRGIRAVDGIDLAIGQGEVLALLGPNGAGKTTLLDIVLGLSVPTAGEALVFGLDPRTAVRAGRVSAVLQTGGLLADFTVRETVQAIASLYPAADPTAVDDVMRRAGIAGFGRRRVSKCSGGQQQRLRFALALLPDPDLIILDEPTAGMDVASRREFWDTMRSDAEAGRTIVFATHYLDEADAFADRAILMSCGRIVADGPTSQIRATAAGRVVSAEFPGGAEQRLDSLRNLPGVRSVELRGDRAYLRAADSDDLARRLLDADARNLEIASANLEDAFVSLTSAPSAPAQPPALAGKELR